MLKKQIGVYVGIDPTASSLHLGHLVTLMPLFWLYMHGFGAYTLIGHSTAKIGDPTGRDQGRPQMDAVDLVQNMTGIHYQLSSMWDKLEKVARARGFERQWSWSRGLVNNNAWWNKLPMLDVLRQLGSGIRMGPLLSRDNVKTRLSSGSGMSFSEFAYPLMQGWDWWELYKQRGVQMQIGGSDQYSNIVIGSQCVKHCIENQTRDPKLPAARMVGFTVPLLTTSSGVKFGKSEGNALWLDPFQTSPYDLYGYLVRRSDDEVERLLNLLTFLPKGEIKQAMEDHQKDPTKRIAQHLLAFEVLSFVHSKELATTTRAQHRQIYSDPSEALGQSNLPPIPVESLRPKVNIQLPKSLLTSTFSKIVAAAELGESVGDAHRLIKGGGIYIGGSPGQGVNAQRGMQSTGQLHFTPMKTWNAEFVDRFLIEGRLMLLRKGKHNIRCVEFIDDKEWEKLGLMYRGQEKTGRLRRAIKILHDLEAVLDTPEDAWDQPEREELRSRLHKVIDEVKSIPSDSQLRRDFDTKLAAVENPSWPPDKLRELQDRVTMLEEGAKLPPVSRYYKVKTGAQSNKVPEWI